MTPKEKALELIHKYVALTDGWVYGIDNWNHKKKCALIAVEEIMKNFDGLHKPEYCAFDAIGERKFTFDGEHEEHMTGYDMIEYWQEVKQEIETL